MINTPVRRKASAWAFAGALLVLTPFSTAASAAGSLDLGAATLTGEVAFDTLRFGIGSERHELQTVSIPLNAIVSTSTPGFVAFAFDPDVDNRYVGGYRGGGAYGIEGYISQLKGFDLQAKVGQVLDLDAAVVTVSGLVNVTDQAWVTFNAANTVTVRGNDDRELGVTQHVSLTGPANQDRPVSWSGQFPYREGPGGTAAVFSAALITIDRIELKVPVQAVPEPSTMGLALLGLLAVGAAASRGRQQLRGQA